MPVLSSRSQNVEDEGIRGRNISQMESLMDLKCFKVSGVIYLPVITLSVAAD